MKQTAVQWLLDKMFKHENLVKGDGWFYVKPEIIEQAKAMEKEQIVNAWETGAMTNYGDAKTYYNETYGKDSTGI